MAKLSEGPAVGHFLKLEFYLFGALCVVFKAWAKAVRLRRRKKNVCLYDPSEWYLLRLDVRLLKLTLQSHMALFLSSETRLLSELKIC